MRILLCFGTRPEAIKMAPVIHELKKQHLHFKTCVTAQHREMLDQVLEFFEVIPDYDLDIMEPNQSLNILSSKIFRQIDEVLIKEDPAVVLVQGDTTSAAMISLAAFHRGIMIGHVEAGLRTNNKFSPFPEEVNRQIISRVVDFHFAPTLLAKTNLLEDRIPSERILMTGNTVVDAILWAEKKNRSLSFSNEIISIKKKFIKGKKIILVTGHRRENFGKRLENICEALLEISKRKDVQLLYPVHLNPNVKEKVYSLLEAKENIFLVPPVSYPTMLWLTQQADLIISDSGGIQEEAPTFKKPVVVTREITERMEGVDAGFSFLVGADKKKIIDTTNFLSENPPNYEGKSNPYGDGTAAAKIVSFLKNFLLDGANSCK